MKVIRYDKLIRDKIPEIISSHGCNYRVKKMNKSDYRRYLVKKLAEEATELQKFKNKKQLNEELADILEVVDSIIKEFKLKKSKIVNIQKKKASKKGVFKKRLLLVKTIEK